MAEWLRNGLQNRVHQFNSGRGLHHNSLISQHKPATPRRFRAPADIAWAMRCHRICPGAGRKRPIHVVWHNLRINSVMQSRQTSAGEHVGEIVRFIPKSELERARLIREARAIYDSIFPPSAPDEVPQDDEESVKN